MYNIAIISPLFLPVPDISGGAIENIITKIVRQNETKGDLNIDLFTRECKQINNINFKKTNVIQAKKNIFEKAIDYILSKINIFHNFRFNKIVSFINSHNKYDYIIVENNMQFYKYLIENIKKDKMTKIIFHLHNNIGGDDKPAELCNLINKTAYKVIVVSDFLKQRWLEITNNQDNVKILYNTINIEKYNNVLVNQCLKEKYGIKDRDIVFEYCGRLDKEKGPDYVVNAFNELSKKYNNIKLIVVGKAFFDKKFEQELLDVKNDNIIFTGQISNDLIADYMSIATIVVIPTIVEEAFGITAIEAMSCGKPIIATNVGGLKEIINTKNGLLVSVSDLKKDIYKKMDYLINSPDLIKDMSVESKKFIMHNKDKYSEVEYLEKFVNAMR